MRRGAHTRSWPTRQVTGIADRAGRSRTEGAGQPGLRIHQQALEAGAYSVGELGRPLLRHRHGEAEGVRLHLLRCVARPEDLPVARHRLDDGDRHVLRLVIPQRDLPLHLVEVRAEPLPVALDALAGTNFTKGTLDWNLPPVRFRAAGNPAFFASWARASIFTSGLVANLDDAPDRVTAGNVGVQADLRFTVLVQQPLTLSVGYARAFARYRSGSDETMVSLKIL